MDNIYLYKKTLYLEQPEHTFVKKQYIKDGVCYNILAKPIYVLEVLAALCILVSLVAVVFFKYQVRNTITLSDPVEYYQGNLNLNLNLSDDSMSTVEYWIGDQYGILVPGESLKTVSCSQPTDNMVLKLRTTWYIFRHEEEIPLNVFKIGD